jgi:hypothetical protein
MKAKAVLLEPLQCSGADRRLRYRRAHSPRTLRPRPADQDWDRVVRTGDLTGTSSLGGACAAGSSGCRTDSPDGSCPSACRTRRGTPLLPRAAWPEQSNHPPTNRRMRHLLQFSSLDPPAVRRAVATAAVVGSTLTIVNQFPLLVSGSVQPWDLLRMTMNYVVPFFVSVYSARAASRGALPLVEE